MSKDFTGNENYLSRTDQNIGFSRSFLLTIWHFGENLGADNLAKGKDKPKTPGFSTLSPDLVPGNVSIGASNSSAIDKKSMAIS